MLFGKFWTAASVTSFNLVLFFGFCTKSSTASTIFFHWEGLFSFIFFAVGSTSGRTGMRYLQPWFPHSDDPSRCILRTTTNCRPYRSSLSRCRFGRSGSSGLVGCFRFPRWSSCVPVRISHALCQDWKFHAGYNLLIHLHKHHHSFEKRNLTKTILFHWKPISPVVL